MFARVSTFEGPPERVDELVHTAVEKILPQLKRFSGFNGILTLADRQSGKVLTVLLWESEEAMRASEEASYWFRRYSAEVASETVIGVERYEVVFSELSRAQP